MNISSNLYILIHSLSKSEKRYITLSIIHGKEKNYLRLFRVLEKMKQWDEKELKRLAKSDKSLRNLPAVKHYLHTYILKKLSAYYTNRSDEIMPHELLIEVDVLYRKGLYSEVHKKLIQLKKMCEKNEDFTALLYYYKWEQRLLGISSYKGKSHRDLTTLLHNETLLLKKIENLSIYYNLSAQMLILIRGKGEIRNKAEEQKIRRLLNHAYLKNANKALSNEAKGYYYYIRSGCYYLLREYNKAIQDTRLLFQLIEPAIYKRKAMLNRYINILNNLISMYMGLKNYDDALLAIQKLRSLSEAAEQRRHLPDNARVAVLSRSYDQELMLYENSGQFDNALKLIPAIEQVIQSHGDKMEPEYFLLFYYNMAYVHFITGGYRHTLHYLNKMLNYSRKDLTMRSDLYSYSKLLQLMAHYELGTESLPEYLVKSVYRFLLKQKHLYKVEDAILRFLRNKVLKGFSPRYLRKDFGNLQQQLIRITANHYEAKALEYFDFISWLESKIQNRPFAEVMKEKASAFGH